MLLAIDVGNTNIVLGVYRDDELIADWRIAVSPNKTYDEYAVATTALFAMKEISFSLIKSAIISSVVPPVTNVITKFIEKYIKVKPLIVGPGIKTGIPIKCDNPREVGADRIVNAIAGIEKYGSPLIIVDFGTATTFDVISSQKEYIGGAIAPGVAISMEALFAKASKLPRVELSVPSSVIGKNTISSIQSGAMYGYAGLVDGIIERIIEELGEDVKVVATGGLSSQIAPISRFMKTSDRYLTLEGLRIVYGRNQSLS